jgi:hypothetical protein
LLHQRRGVAGVEVSPITISLEGLRGARQTTPDPDTARLALLYHQVLAQESELTTDDATPRRHASLQALFDAIEREHGGGDAADGAGRAREGRDRDFTDRSQRARLAALDAEYAHAGPAQGRGDAASTGPLWGQIKPCWDRLPDRSTVDVTLVVSLNARGMIATPPTILRPTPAPPDQRRLISEARALAALAACVPYQTVDFAGPHRFRIEFSPRGSKSGQAG